ncbi:MAG: ferrous iron transporter B [Epsilonproteobacteria bacterium]|nr:MAG: ferrous iron transporter B [Campylobacterota bacterium]RLA66063.1 MAG: ferrous iron transporter B [Campylobacterota bacterium]
MGNVLLIGKPNSGKSLLFNRLTGLQQKVANFPGVTVEIKSGSFDNIGIIDFPGIYSLNPLTKDEDIALQKFQEAVEQNNVSGIICTLDATRLERSLIIALQTLNYVKENKIPIIFALNMMDEIYANKTSIDVSSLSRDLGVVVIPISAKKKHGLDILKDEIKNMLKVPGNYLPEKTWEDEKIVIKSRGLNQTYGPKTDVILKKQNFLDKIFLNNFLGGIMFALIMIFLFQAIFTWASPLMDMVESTLAWMGQVTSSYLPDGVLKDFINEAIFGGVGSFLVFVPQIFILTFIIGILEDSGYMARASIICHKPLSLFGLSGRSFIPYLTAHACAIPAIFAARTIESPKKRLITILTIPLMACSARLPVYTLLIAVLIPDKTFFGGVFGLQGLAFFLLYFFGLAMALIVSGLLSRTTLKDESDSPYIIELPPYRLPTFVPLFRKSLSAAWAFFSKAGPIIFVVTLVVWVLGYFPNGSGNLENSWLSHIGQFLEPIFKPLGLDWKYGVAILASFLAREVFVGTLGTFFGIEGADENISGLAESIQNSGLLAASGFALLVFYAIALQCVSTLAILKRESGNKLFPIWIFVGYTVLAYLLALLTYNLVSWFS